jgi:hypothetical protein
MLAHGWPIVCQLKAARLALTAASVTGVPQPVSCVNEVKNNWY